MGDSSATKRNRPIPSIEYQKIDTGGELKEC